MPQSAKRLRTRRLTLQSTDVRGVGGGGLQQLDSLPVCLLKGRQARLTGRLRGESGETPPLAQRAPGWSPRRPPQCALTPEGERLGRKRLGGRSLRPRGGPAGRRGQLHLRLAHGRRTGRAVGPFSLRLKSCLNTDIGSTLRRRRVQTGGPGLKPPTLRGCSGRWPGRSAPASVCGLSADRLSPEVLIATALLLSPVPSLPPAPPGSGVPGRPPARVPVPLRGRLLPGECPPVCRTHSRKHSGLVLERKHHRQRGQDLPGNA